MERFLTLLFMNVRLVTLAVRLVKLALIIVLHALVFFTILTIFAILTAQQAITRALPTIALLVMIIALFVMFHQPIVQHVRPLVLMRLSSMDNHASLIVIAQQQLLLIVQSMSVRLVTPVVPLVSLTLTIAHLVQEFFITLTIYAIQIVQQAIMKVLPMIVLPATIIALYAMFPTQTVQLVKQLDPTKPFLMENHVY